tara:strand:+ start:162 stop:314 length:153 start_codon:yes stop_codon:yes gene_type:complete
MKSFDINVGIYPGVLIGIRTYKDYDSNTHAIYLPFFSIHIVVFKDTDEWS